MYCQTFFIIEYSRFYMPRKHRTSSSNGLQKSTGKPRTKRCAERVAVVPGSFDPLTHGHIDIIERALGIFDRVVVGVLMNPSKTALFSDRERVEIISRELASTYVGRLEVLSFSGLLVEFVRRVGSRVVIRGLRAISDFDYEAQMSLINHKLDPDVETLFLTAREEHSYISSTIVKQVALLGGDVTDMVPERVAEALSKKRSGIMIRS
jgi:pantetheine-phosphate adenylyltransferase